MMNSSNTIGMESFLALHKWSLETNKLSNIRLAELNREWQVMKTSLINREQQAVRVHQQKTMFLSNVKEVSKCEKHSGDVSSSSSSHTGTSISSSSSSSSNSQSSWKIKKRIQSYKIMGSDTGVSHFPSGGPETVRKRGNRKLVCTVCGLVCQHNAHFQIHMRTHTGEKPFKCNFCERAFAQKSDLTKHERIHTGEKPFKCDICEKAFAIGKSLQDHRRQHTGERPYECSECERRFRNSSGLSEHRKTHRKQYEREMFGKVDKKTHGLSLIKQHEGSDTARCSFCGKNYPSRQSLLSHVRMVHMKNTPYQCAKCRTSYSSIHGLCLHVGAVHRHTNVQQQSLLVPLYKCSGCVSKFTTRVALIEHTQDTGHGHLKCDVCDLTVEDLEQLVDHRWQHQITGHNEITNDKCKRLNKTTFRKGIRILGGNSKNKKSKDINLAKKHREPVVPGKLRVMTILPIEAFKELSEGNGSKDEGDSVEESTVSRKPMATVESSSDTCTTVTGTDYVFRSCEKKEKNKRMSLLPNKKPSKHSEDSKHYESLNIRQLQTHNKRLAAETETYASSSYLNCRSSQRTRNETRPLHMSDADPLFVSRRPQEWDKRWLDESIDIISI
ncbi:zinc finger protein 665-like [Homarus americanus]|uniref:zinc finger protein 665-like n=1 Tax=Homarus americanus TaxID=6706 RepID=UPI001C46738A|nr:zinc finger protein 665-like [Homarus americanus]